MNQDFVTSPAVTTRAEYDSYKSAVTAALHRGEISLLDWELGVDRANREVLLEEKRQMLSPESRPPNSIDCVCGSAARFKGKKKST